MPPPHPALSALRAHDGGGWASAYPTLIEGVVANDASAIDAVGQIRACIAADADAKTLVVDSTNLVTALAGGPFFIWLLRRDARGLGGSR